MYSLLVAYLIKYQEYSLKNAFLYIKSLRPCARPNVGFFEQLLRYESFYRKQVSVAMNKFTMKGKQITVPDFYKTDFPDLYKVEVNKQLTADHKSAIELQTSNQNYLNRNRDYKEMQDDMDQILATKSDLSDAQQEASSMGKKKDKKKDNKKGK